MKKIAFITATTHPHIANDDQRWADYLAIENIIVEAAAWDNSNVDWTNYQALIFRSCWNYHLKPNEFQLWLEQMASLNLKFFNPISVVQWNLHKQYLFDLQSRGVEIPPGVLIQKNEKVKLENIVKKHDWKKVVVKPAISATAKGTWVAETNQLSEHQSKFEESISQGDVIVQDFMNEIHESGELSLLYFGKKFSHAVLKRPKKNDFRVQNDFGGTVESFQPDAGLIKKGEQILELIDEPLLYARIDGVIRNNRFVLMELELIEPVLFLNEAPSLQPLSAALLESVGQSTH